MELLNDTFAVFEDPVCNDPNKISENTNNIDGFMVAGGKVAVGLCPYCANFAHCNWKMNKKIYCEHYE